MGVERKPDKKRERHRRALVGVLGIVAYCCEFEGLRTVQEIYEELQSTVGGELTRYWGELESSACFEPQLKSIT